ncbi:retrovirus-related pol polyprotein from transposon TNT 1-94 [Tanacetum coccineum]
MGLWYSKNSEFELIAYSDADLAGCNDDCKSTSGGIQFLRDKLVSWSSKKQDYTSMSTSKAEYVSLSTCCAQAIWMRTQLLNYGFRYNKIPIYCDSQSAIAISLLHMAQQVIPAAQLVPRYLTIGRCNNYVMVKSIPCSPECKIVGQILLDHPLSYALTATADVHVVYLQQFWRTVSKVPDTEDTIKFMLDTEEFTYTVDMFRVTLYLPVETPENPFVAPANIQTIEAFMNRVGYQDIPQRVDEDYHSIKDDTPLVSVYTIRNVLVRGMLILDVFLTEEICATDDFKEYETVFVRLDVPINQPQPVVSTQGMHMTTPRAHRTPTVSTASPQRKKRKKTAGELSSPQKSLKITIRQKQMVEGEKDDDDSKDSLEPESHKENPEYVDDDDDEEKVDEEKDVDMRSLETRIEEMQTPIPTPPRSPRINLSSDKKITQELTDTVPLPTATTSKTPHSKRRISSKYSHLLSALSRMCRRQGYMIQNMEQKATDDLIENNLKPSITATIIEDRDAFRSEVDRVLHEIVPQLAEKATDDLIENNLKPSIAANILTNLMPKHQRSSKNFSRITYKAIHDDHQKDDAPPEGEKRVKRHKASKKETVIDDDEVILKDETHELITELQNVDKHVPTIFDRARMDATLNDMLSNQFKNAEEYGYHLEQATSFMENQMVWESEQVDIRRPVPRPLVFCGPQWNPNEPPRITTNQPHDLDFMEQIIVMRENDKPYSFSEADFKYLNKNDIEDLYYLCRNKKVNYRETKLMNSLITFIISRVIWERVYDFQLGIKSYQVKVNLTAPTLIFPDIKAYGPYSIVDKTNTGLIYLNNKYEKWVMYLVEIVKFCDATLEKVLKEVKLKTFQSEPWRKPPLLGELDRDILRALEREITKRLRHRPFPEAHGKVKFLIVAIDYFTKWIKAKPVETITGNQIKKFIWDNIVCRFGLPGEIVSDNGKQFRDNPFKDWCENLNIKQRLDEENRNWVKEVPHVLWAHRTMIKTSNGDTLFSLTYGTEAIIPVEIGMPSLRCAEVNQTQNDEALLLNLDILEEKREKAAIREAKSKTRMEKYHNTKVRNITFQPGDFVYHGNEANQVKEGEKLSPK